MRYQMVIQRLGITLLAAALIWGNGLAMAGTDSETGEATAADNRPVEEMQADEEQPEAGEVLEPAEGAHPQSAPDSSHNETGDDETAAARIDFTADFNEFDWPDPVPRPAVIEPLFVQAFSEIVAGHNDSNPVWSPAGDLLAFERSIEDKREIIISRSDGWVLQKIYHRMPAEKSEIDFGLADLLDDTSYNAGISWSPDESKLVFMSNGGSGNYDLYLLPALGEDKTIRLTEHAEKDSHPHWSPVADRLVFVSGRDGSANIYVMDLVSGIVTQLTNGRKTHLYPQWSPDGAKIVMIYGSNENHDIYLIEDINRPEQSLKALTTWSHDDLRPMWSPDGKKIAFYSNYNLENDANTWSILVISADGSDPAGGDGLAEKVVAVNVIPDIERGPAWMPDSSRLVYVKNDRQAYNPIYLVQIDNKKNQPIHTQTKMNHDLACSPDGTLAFRAQVEQWDHIYTARLKQ